MCVRARNSGGLSVLSTVLSLWPLPSLFKISKLYNCSGGRAHIANAFEESIGLLQSPGRGPGRTRRGRSCMELQLRSDTPRPPTRTTDYGGCIFSNQSARGWASPSVFISTVSACSVMLKATALVPQFFFHLTTYGLFPDHARENPSVEHSQRHLSSADSLEET